MSLLSKVKKGKRPAPDRIVLYGVEGVGKSTFGAGFPAPIFIAAEDGVRHLDVTSFPEAKSKDDIGMQIRSLASEEHEYQTLVIDTVDWVEPLIWNALIEENKWGNKGIEAPGYGKGYTMALDVWRKLLSMLDILRMQKGMRIILLAHSHIVQHSNPEGADYSRHEGKINKKAWSLVKEWADMVLFANHEIFVQEQDGMTKAKGVSTDRRIVHTSYSAAHDGKNRHNLAPVLELGYLQLMAAIQEGAK